MLKINIITQLLIFFAVAISINLLQLNLLIGLFIFLIAMLIFTKNKVFLRSMLRFKWFFVVMLFIFAFNTPGQHLAIWPFDFSPTYEGIIAGLTQMLRMLIMLAGISIILACNTRQQLISGFYFIFSPLKYFGLKVERFAARLWLTLHYVELQSQTKHSHDFMSQLKNMAMLKPNQVNEDVSVTLTVQKFNIVDFALLIILMTSALFFIFKAFA
jgi:energy-coupling factor transporter transmembrane protein EcfT